MKEQERVLVVANDGGFVERLGLALEWRQIEMVTGTWPAVTDVDLVILDSRAVPDWIETYANKDVPLLVLGDFRDEMRLIRALQAGALACLPWPASPELTAAQAKALLAVLARHEGTAHESTPIEIGALTVDPANRRVWIQGRIVRLTTAEFELLSFMAHRPGEVLSRDQLYLHTRGIAHNGLDRSLDLRIARLRKKLGDDARNPRFILAIRGVGYLLAAAS